ncbi:hypothetical protein MRB53_028202 [Persea americana]|uniref:Uncharacterized protein n=1 Tax=Persea americana TaxID=3435 RepID=A0ACC2KF13_PERAE|nr:hypothetical protein MRB53_028202 [Persea americana]
MWFLKLGSKVKSTDRKWSSVPCIILSSSDACYIIELAILVYSLSFFLHLRRLNCCDLMSCRPPFLMQSSRPDSRRSRPIHD